MYYNDPAARPVHLLALALFVFFGVLLIVSEAWTDFRLAREGLRVPGVVTAVYPKNHDTVEYKFEFQGKTYTGLRWRTSETVGSPVTVWLDPNNPAFSMINDPYVVGWNSIRFLFMFLGAVITAFAVLLVVDRWRCARVESRSPKR